MVSVDSLLEGHEVAVRARVDELREEATRVATALGEAELALEYVTITKATLAVVLAGHGVASEARQETMPVPEAGRASVPVWHSGLDEQALPAGYRRLWTVLVQAAGSVRAQDAARGLGFEPIPAKVEGTRSKLKRLARCGWLVESSPGVFRVADGAAR